MGVNWEGRGVSQAVCFFCLIQCFFLVLIVLKAVWKYSGCGLTAGGGEPVKGSVISLTTEMTVYSV